MYKFNSIDEAIQDIKEGKMIIVIDDPDRENEGDLVMAAEKVTADDINFMAKYGRGLICMPLDGNRLKELEIQAMVENNTDNYETAFTVSIDHMDTRTGISAYERALTIQKVLSDGAKKGDFRKPGHVFPLKAKEGGVLKRIGHTEAAVDLGILAGLKPAGVICEIMNEDGTLHNSIIIYAKAFRKAYKYLVKEGYVEERLWEDTEISKWIGLNAKDMWNEFMPQLSEEEKKICSNMIGSYMIQYINEGKAKLYEGSIDVLQYLNEKGFKLILLSNCKTQYMESHRRVFNLDNYFKDIYSSEEFNFIAKYEIFKTIKAKYGGRFLVIGDRYQDIEIAKIHDLISIGCKYGFGKEEELKGSDFLIDNISEIRNILDKIN